MARQRVAHSRGGRIGAALAGLALALLAAPSTVKAAPLLGAEVGASSCAWHFPAVEAREGLPAGILASIARVESGSGPLGDRQSGWPWTIDVMGKGQFFATKTEAVETVRRLRAQGVRNIDVGCMQVNLMYHPQAFASLEDALDPAHNIAYAGKFLKALWRETGSWAEAVSRYHSADDLLLGTYRQRVFAAWGLGPLSGGTVPIRVVPPGGRAPAASKAQAKPAMQMVVTPWGAVRVFRPTVSLPAAGSSGATAAAASCAGRGGGLTGCFLTVAEKKRKKT